MESVADRFAIDPMYLEWPDIWFSNLLCNGLFRYDMEKGRVVFLKAFPHERGGQLFLHKAVLEHYGKLFFFPDQGRHIHIVDMETQEMESLDISEFYPGDSVCKITQAVKEEDRFLLLPGNFNHMPLYLYPEEKRIEKAHFEIRVGHNCKGKFQNLVWSSVRCGNHIYAPLFRTNFLLDIDLAGCIVSEKRIKGFDMSGIKLIENRVWIYPASGDGIQILDIELNVLRTISLGVKPGNNYRLSGLVKWGDDILCLPYSGNTFYRIAKDGVCELLFPWTDALKENPVHVSMPGFGRTICHGTELLLLPHRYKNCILLSQSGEFRIGAAFCLETKERKELARQILDDAVDIRYPIGEEIYYSLNDYLQKVMLSV